MFQEPSKNGIRFVRIRSIKNVENGTIDEALLSQLRASDVEKIFKTLVAASVVVSSAPLSLPTAASETAAQEEQLIDCLASHYDHKAIFAICEKARFRGIVLGVSRHSKKGGETRFNAEIDDGSSAFYVGANGEQLFNMFYASFVERNEVILTNVYPVALVKQCSYKHCGYWLSLSVSSVVQVVGVAAMYRVPEERFNWLTVDMAQNAVKGWLYYDIMSIFI